MERMIKDAPNSSFTRDSLKAQMENSMIDGKNKGRMSRDINRNSRDSRNSNMIQDRSSNLNKQLASTSAIV
jgi:hypothetical protein